MQVLVCVVYCNGGTACQVDDDRRSTLRWYCDWMAVVWVLRVTLWVTLWVTLSFFGCGWMSPFVAELRTFEMSSFCSLETHLYVHMLSMLRWPVLPMISCSSTPLWKCLVALVTRKEWFVLKPPIPAASHTLFLTVCYGQWGWFQTKYLPLVSSVV